MQLVLTVLPLCKSQKVVVVRHCHGEILLHEQKQGQEENGHAA